MLNAKLDRIIELLEKIEQNTGRKKIVRIPKEDRVDTPLQNIVKAYKIKKGFDKFDTDWDKMNFARCAKSAKQLLDYFKDWKIAVNCIDELGDWFDKQNLTWTLESVTKRASEWKLKKENNDD